MQAPVKKCVRGSMRAAHHSNRQSPRKRVVGPDRSDDEAGGMQPYNPAHGSESNSRHKRWQRIEELRAEMRRHEHLYYVMDAPEISDRNSTS